MGEALTDVTGRRKSLDSLGAPRGGRRRASGRLGLVPVALLLALLWGCEPPGPTGISGVLFFVHSGSPYVGQTQSIRIPPSVHVGGESIGRLWLRSRTYQYDFHGTRIEASLPAGAALVAAELGADGYTLTIRCDAEAGPELWVSIAAGGKLRYRDGTYLRCYGNP